MYGGEKIGSKHSKRKARRKKEERNKTKAGL